MILLSAIRNEVIASSLANQKVRGLGVTPAEWIDDEIKRKSKDK